MGHGVFHGRKFKAEIDLDHHSKRGIYCFSLKKRFYCRFTSLIGNVKGSFVKNSHCGLIVIFKWKIKLIHGKS